jgi:hypothetical protein
MKSGTSLRAGNKRVAHTHSVGLRLGSAAAPRLRRDWLPPPSSAGLPQTDNPGAELPNSKAEADLPHSKGCRSALQLSWRGLFIPWPKNPRHTNRAVATSLARQGVTD